MSDDKKLIIAFLVIISIFFSIMGYLVYDNSLYKYEKACESKEKPAQCICIIRGFSNLIGKEKTVEALKSDNMVAIIYSEYLSKDFSEKMKLNIMIEGCKNL